MSALSIALSIKRIIPHESVEFSKHRHRVPKSLPRIGYASKKESCTSSHNTSLDGADRMFPIKSRNMQPSGNERSNESTGSNPGQHGADNSSVEFQSVADARGLLQIFRKNLLHQMVQKHR